MASWIRNPVTNTTNSERIKRKKKNSMMKANQQQSQQKPPSHAAWKSEAQQKIYSSKLLQALRRINLNSTPPSPSASRGSRAVREAADKALAVSAKGRTRWSRAILTSRLKLKFRKQKRSSSQRGSASAAVAAITRTSRSKKPRVCILKLKAKSVPSVQRKVKVLGRLVPGCRREPLPILLEEATDYISALEMQVRAMSALADLLSGSGAASSSSAPPPQLPRSIDKVESARKTTCSGRY